MYSPDIVAVVDSKTGKIKEGFPIDPHDSVKAVTVGVRGIKISGNKVVLEFNDGSASEYSFKDKKKIQRLKKFYNPKEPNFIITSTSKQSPMSQLIETAQKAQKLQLGSTLAGAAITGIAGGALGAKLFGKLPLTQKLLSVGGIAGGAAIAGAGVGSMTGYFIARAKINKKIKELLNQS